MAFSLRHLRQASSLGPELVRYLSQLPKNFVPVEHDVPVAL